MTAYLSSLPERVVRSLSALTGGALQGIGEIVLPARVRRTRIYDSMVVTVARFLAEQVGQMEGQGETELPKDFLLRRTAGNVIELAGIAAFHSSPVWVLAALADVVGAGRGLIVEIAEALKQEGLLDKGATFESVDQLLDGLERTSGRLAEAVNTPPLNVAGLRQEWSRVKADAASIPKAVLPSADALWVQWRDLQSEAAKQERSVVEVSTLMALAAIRHLPENTRRLSSALRVGGRQAGRIVVRDLLDHYRLTLERIADQGFYEYWMTEYRPYLRAALDQFSPERVSTTERLLGLYDEKMFSTALAAARIGHQRMAELPAAIKPVTLDAAYDMQDAVVAGLLTHFGGSVIGYKIACTNEIAQKQLHVDAPFFGRLLSATTHESGVELDPALFFMRVMEAEFAFRMAKPLPPRATPYTRDEVADAVEGVMPGIEVVDSRFDSWTTVGTPSLIADNACHAAWVRGALVTAWRAIDLAAQVVRLEINGQTIGTGSGAAVLGHPLNALHWLANALNARKIGLEAGQYVTTGVTTDIYLASAGDRVMADFGAVGRVELRFR